MKLNSSSAVLMHIVRHGVFVAVADILIETVATRAWDAGKSYVAKRRAEKAEAQQETEEN